MYADRYHSTASRPAGAGAALLISGAMILGLYYAGPTIAPGVFDDPLVVRPISIPEPPKPQPEPQPRAKQPVRSRTTHPITQPDPRVVLPPTGPAIDITRDPGPVVFDPPGPTGLGGGGGITLDPPRAPVLVGAAVDPRYLDALQPPYPPSAIRGGIEGTVTVRALIGVDGRVKAIEVTKSPSDLLSEATRRHALARWRFKPATRDGVPVEGWKTMTMRFQIVE